MRSPTLFVSAQLLHRAKLLEEFDTGVFVIDGRLRPAAGDQAEFTVGGQHQLCRAPGEESAVEAGLATDAQRAAWRAFYELAVAAALPLLMLRRYGSPVEIERPLHAVFG